MSDCVFVENGRLAGNDINVSVASGSGSTGCSLLADAGWIQWKSGGAGMFAGVLELSDNV